MFCGVDTSICVETSIRDAFNLGYYIIMIPLERVRDYYGIATHLQELKEIINILKQIRRGRTGYKSKSGHIGGFLEKHNLIDKSKYHIQD